LVARTFSAEVLLSHPHTSAGSAASLVLIRCFGRAFRREATGDPPET
jgi:hypothetical protein